MVSYIDLKFISHSIRWLMEVFIMSDTILANVGGMPITSADVDAFLAGLGQRGQSYNNPQGRAVILEQLIGQKLFLMDATRNLYEAEPAFKAELLAKLVSDVWPKVEAGMMKPSIYKVLPITEAEEAHAILQRGENVGKVVLQVK